jgi:hypothetical protein
MPQRVPPSGTKKCRFLQAFYLQKTRFGIEFQKLNFENPFYVARKNDNQELQQR